MTQEDKELLLKDISGRLPYGPIVQVSLFRNDVRKRDVELGPHVTENIWEKIDKYHALPYLRPMSSMTEEERKKIERLINEKLNRNIEQEDNEWTPWVLYDTTGIINSIGGERFYFDEMSFIYNWLNAHHFDYRELIPRGLAIEVTEENNPYKNLKI